MPNQNKTEITFILDKSGSMTPVQDATIEMINSYAHNQKRALNDGEDCTFSLIQFSDTYHVTTLCQPIQAFTRLTTETYQPAGGTALLGAIGKTIDQLGNRFSRMLEWDRPANVLVIIQTDGQENMSHLCDWSIQYTQTRVFNMIAHQRDVYNWTFVFLGADQDAIASATALGISHNNALGYANRRSSIGALARKMSDSSNVFRDKSVGVASCDFMTSTPDLKEYEKDEKLGSVSSKPVESKPAEPKKDAVKKDRTSIT